MRHLHRFVIGDDFKGERRNAVAEVAKLQVFEDCIGCAAIGWAVRSLGTEQQRVRLMIAAAIVKAQTAPCLQIAGRAAQQIAIGPDPAEPLNRPAGQGHGETCGIAVGCGLGLAFAAASYIADLLEICRPDNRAAHAHSAKMSWHRTAIGGCR